MIEILIVIFTIFLSTRANPLIDNITGIMNVSCYRHLAIFYIIFSASYFGLYMYRLFYKSSMNRMFRTWIILTTIMMSLGALFRYTEGGQDLFSFLHLFCSMFGCISFLILLFIYTRYLSVYNIALYLKIHWFYDGLIQFLVLFILFFGRINGYVEILYSFIVCGYILLIRYTNNKCI